MPDKDTKTVKTKIVLWWTAAAFGVLAVFILLLVGACAAYGRMYENRIFPGVRVLSVRLDGLTKSEARKAVQDSIDNVLSKGLRFNYDGRELVIDPSVVSTDPDASRDLVRYDVDQALEQAYALGRDAGWISNAAEQLGLRVSPKEVPPRVTLDRSGLDEALQAAAERELHPVKDARLSVNASTTPATIGIEPEQSGLSLITSSALDELTYQARRLEFKPIALSDQIINPTVTAKDLEALMPEAENIMARPQLVLTHDDQEFPVTATLLGRWLTVTGTQREIALTLDAQKFAADIKTLAAKIEKPGKNGGLEIKDGKIVSFTPGNEGVEIDTAATYAVVMRNWPTSSTLAIVTHTAPGRLVGEDPEKLGIKDLLGVGTSNFSGSPKNRLKNIARAIELLNGTVIEPDQVFSLIDTMGEIDGKHGWFPEMVIKGNETKPEYGGGLCQIGTTVFRAAMKSGLPIVERANHSYRVRYYEPAGTDATVYGPHPDMRFKNDTGHPIYINAYQKGNELFFEYWGTSDGRKGEIGKSHVYNIVPPPPTKLIETLELAPGKKKCSEIAHTGADADFTYTITAADGTVTDRIFRSHYRPWQAVCMIGVEKLSDPVGTATSTTAN